MRKGKRFTPARIQRWQANGRGVGTKEEYVPWHMVSRDDPGSRGKSHQVNWRFGRQHHFLSDQELVAFGFITMLPSLVDVREQFPLAQKTHAKEISAYQWPPSSAPDAQGTLEIAADLGLKHPRVNGEGVSTPWVMTSDFVVTITMPNQRPALLVVSVKAGEELEDRRTVDLLRIEREYWRRQDVSWLLVSQSTYQPAMNGTMKSAMAWAVRPEPIDDQLLIRLLKLSTEVAALQGLTLRAALNKLQADFSIDMEEAQILFWRAVWTAVIPLDLTMPVRPGAVIRLLDQEEFVRQNPVASRRTAWRS